MIVLGIAGFSGSGKTTLLTRLIPLLRQRGLRVAVIKHTHHDFDPDIPGKDSYRLREAGAAQVLAASDRRWALFTELPEPQEPQLETLLAQLDPARSDLVLVEGMRHGKHPKLEVHRPSLGHPLLARDDPWIRAVASDAPLDCPCPRLDLNGPDAVAGFIEAFHRRGVQAQS
ncbi:molybdopterin-guanine dinucleotide biosynthesis protein B [Thermithiobacillus plumbiphilus]|uniref:Molybdopterin-guanine dinucleotide biosynthesis protein B n=1 Tax=Thermithiobacillus plumbiphilus TaxID=1729899 RepID=A0ABU9D717_9PROT